MKTYKTGVLATVPIFRVETKTIKQLNSSTYWSGCEKIRYQRLLPIIFCHEDTMI